MGAAFGLDATSAHRSDEPRRAILDADVVMMGGGNTFRLLDSLHHLDVIEGLGERVRRGETRYMGASAGTNVACPTIRTTNAVVLQHAPGRTRLGDFGTVVMPTPATEINLIETFAATKVIGLTINHENMTDADVSTAITRYEDELGIPATDSLTRPEGHLVDMVLAAFPQLEEKLNASAR